MRCYNLLSRTIKNTILERPIEGWCEPHISYIRRLEEYINILEDIINSSEEKVIE